MARRISAAKSKKKAFKNRQQSEIELILKDYCSHCKEPTLGRNSCETCEINKRVENLFWMIQLSDAECDV